MDKQPVYDLYDKYCHGEIDRREFLRRAAALTVGGSALLMAQGLLPQYALAQTISFTDQRIKATYEKYPSPGGNLGNMRGYLVAPVSKAPFGAVLVIHENRGLNPYIEDVARRLATAGFLALAPDGLFPSGGYPGNDDDGRAMQAALDQAKLETDLLNSAEYVKSHKLSNGKLGAVGFCYGGGMVNKMATILGDRLQAGVPYYGIAPDLKDVKKIKAHLLCHLAENDDRVNVTYPEYEKALKTAGIDYKVFSYKGTQHGFHNNSTPRYDEKAAQLSWDRTLEHFKKYLG